MGDNESITNDPAERIVRDFEHGILDRYYEHFNLMRYDEKVSIPYLLKAFGDFHRQTREMEELGYTDQQIQSIANNVLSAVTYCLRWVHLKLDSGLDIIESHQAADDKVKEFIGWGLTYTNLAQEFTAWSRGLKKMQYDAKRNTIRFTNVEVLDFARLLLNQRLYIHQMEKYHAAIFSVEVLNLFEEWHSAIDDLEPPIANCFEWGEALQSTVFDELKLFFRSQILTEIDVLTDLGGYTLDDFLVFHTCMFLNCYFICWVENKTDEQYKDELNPFGSNPLPFTGTMLQQFLSEKTGLSEIKIASIIADLVFDPTKGSSHLAIQPIVRSKDGIYYLLPNLYPYLNTQRMLIGSFSKGEKKKIYDHLINQIQQTWLNKIAALIQTKTNWECYLEKGFSVGRKRYTPDFILIDRQSKTIVIMDYKHFLSPMGVTEVAHRYSEMQKGFRQIQGYINAYFLSELATKQLKGTDIVSIHGVLLTQSPLVVPVPKKQPIHLFDFFSMEILLNAPDASASLQSYVEMLQNVKLLDTHLSTTIDAIKVEDWTIEREGAGVVLPE